MRNIFLVLVLVLGQFSSLVNAKDFDEHLHLQVLKYDGSTLSMKVKEANVNFPASTVLYATVTEHKPNRRFMRSEFIKGKITEAVFPNGTSQKYNRDFKVRTKRLGGKRAIGNTVIGTTGLVLGITINFLTVGLPVARGGLALWNAGYNIHETAPEDNSLKEGAKGFISGALFPLPQILLKSKQLDLRAGRDLLLMSADDDERVTGVAFAL